MLLHGDCQLKIFPSSELVSFCKPERDFDTVDPADSSLCVASIYSSTIFSHFSFPRVQGYAFVGSIVYCVVTCVGQMVAYTCVPRIILSAYIYPSCLVGLMWVAWLGWQIYT